VGALVFVAGLAEAGRRFSRRWVIASTLVAAALVGAAAAHALGVAGDTIVAAYDASLACALVTVGIVTRAPGRPILTDLAVDLGPQSVRGVDSLMRLVRAEPGLETDLRAAIESARRWESANAVVRAELQSAVSEVTESRRRLVTVEAEERARLATDVHKTTIGALRALVDRADDAGVAPRLRRALTSLEGAIAGLRAPDLDDGIARAVRALPLVAELSATLDLSDARCSEVVEDTLFAVAAECLSNSAKYAAPCRVGVRYSVADGVAEMLVTDQGPGGARVGGGSGLVTLADRVEALGGRFSVDSLLGAGTVVRAEVPRQRS
jgi:signal transduction histidine kinase